MYVDSVIYCLGNSRIYLALRFTVLDCLQAGSHLVQIYVSWINSAMACIPPSQWLSHRHKPISVAFDIQVSEYH